MSRELTAEELERYADGEVSAADAAAIEQHLLQCSDCTAAVLHIMQMKRAIRDAAEERPLLALRERIRQKLTGEVAPPRRLPPWWVAAAAVVALVVITFLIERPRSASAMPELADMHVTLLA